MAKDKGLTKSCKDCSLKKYENEKKGLKLTHQHFWIRKDGSKITDPWEIVYDHKRYNCTKYRKEKTVKESVIYGSKYNPKSCKVCKICNDYRRGEKDEKYKRGEFKMNGTRMDI